MTTVKEEEMTKEPITEEPQEVSEAEVKELTPEERVLKAQNIIKNHTMTSLGFGVVPIPVVDLVGITGTQLNMLRSLSNLYGQKFTEDLGKKSIASLLGGWITLPASMGLFSMLKSIPVIGQTAGVISIGATGAASTYAVGRVFAQHFESGGTFLTFDPSKVRDYFKKEFTEGKNVAKNIQSETKDAA